MLSCNPPGNPRRSCPYISTRNFLKVTMLRSGGTGWNPITITFTT